MTQPLESPAPTGATIVEERSNAQLDEGDHERFAHYVRKEKIVESAVTGAPVVALCGKVWVPSRDPQKFPVCPECDAIYNGLPVSPRDGSGAGRSGGSGGAGGSGGGASD